MAEPHSYLEDPTALEPAAALRAELAQVRAQAEAERQRLEHELKLARSAQPSQRDPITVTQNVAGQQEIQALRNTLREKDRVIEQLTTQCRDLEDQLEDNFQQLDALRLRVQQRELDLDQAQARRRSAQQPHAREPARDAPAQHRPEPPARPASIPTPPRPRHRATTVALPRRRSSAYCWVHCCRSRPPPGFGGAVIGRPRACQRQCLPHPALRPRTTPVTTGAAATSEPDPVAETVPPAEPQAPETPPVRGKVRDRNGPQMIALNPGTFRMGNPAGASGSDARPARDVSLGAFLIGAREVSFAEYDRFVSATGARRPNDYGFGRGKQPVIDVTWADAVNYTRWLSRITGRNYRLPTEAEWEYAARAGAQSLFWWGSDAPAGRAVCFDCGSRLDRIAPAPTGFSGPNAFGLYDTAGNVYEWVADCYRPSYRDAPTDGSAVTDIGCRERVARGGSFKAPAKSMHVFARRAFEPDTRIDTIGFRVARDAN